MAPLSGGDETAVLFLEFKIMFSKRNTQKKLLEYKESILMKLNLPMSTKAQQESKNAIDTVNNSVTWSISGFLNKLISCKI